MKCHNCGKCFQSFPELIKHIKKDCLWSLDPVILKCGEGECNRKFSVLRQFRKHLETDHQLGVGTSVGQPIPCSSLADEPMECCDEPIDLVADDGGSSIDIDSNDTLLHHTYSFLVGLYKSPGVTRSTVQNVVDGMQLFLNNIAPVITKSVMNSLVPSVGSGENSVNDLQQCVDKVVSTYTSVLSPFRTEFFRLKQFAAKGSYVPPEECIIGHRSSVSSKNSSLTVTPVKMQVIPLSKIFHRLLSNEGYSKAILDYTRHCDDMVTSSATIPNAPKCLENVMQGSAWRDFISKNPNTPTSMTLPLLLYYDDFEVGNPLGSHAGVHKLGGVYVSLPALPPHMFSQLDNIFLLAIFHSKDRVSFGNKSVFSPCIKELNYLHSTGIFLDTNIFKGRIAFKTIALCSDNLGLNSALGFVESFSANFCCRMCNIGKEQMHTAVRVVPELSRNMTSYREQLKLNNASLTGIKEECCWLALTGFQLFETPAVDVMHDLLEGTCRYTMTFVCNKYIRDSLINPNIFKETLRSFDYGPDSSSKPNNAVILDGSHCRLKCSASEMIVFVRYFGLLIGRYIPAEDPIWQLYVLLRKILDIVMALRIYDYTYHKLDSVVTEFNTLYLLLTDDKLKPKNHFMTHYADMMKRFGPLRPIWSMRFEAKHRTSKSVARSTATRVNTTKTVAIRHQLALVSRLSDDCVPDSSRVLGKTVSLSMSVADSLPSLTPPLRSYKSVRLDGSEWTLSSIVLVDFADDEDQDPVFGRITHIIETAANDLYFYCSMFDTIEFNEHYQAYEVKPGNTSQLLSVVGLIAPVPCHLTIQANYCHYITLRWYIDS